MKKFETQEELVKFVEVLVKPICELSNDKTHWAKAKQEWKLWDYGINEGNKQEVSCCLCHSPMFHCFALRNQLNGNTICPICLNCIEQMDEEGLRQKVNVMMNLYALYSIVKDKGTIYHRDFHFDEIPLLDFLHDRGAIGRWQHDFMVDLIGRRKVSPKQTAIYQRIVNESIAPWVLLALGGTTLKNNENSSENTRSSEAENCKFFC